MYTPAPDEKITPVVVYARSKLIQGDLVTKENVRVSIWLRIQELPNYIHLLHAKILFFGGSPPKALAYDEYCFPTGRIIAFHLKGKIRISTRADFATGLEVSHMTWLSVYQAEITNPFQPQIPVIHVPMLLINPKLVSFGI